jgi:hypothetical protein
MKRKVGNTTTILGRRGYSPQEVLTSEPDTAALQRFCLRCSHSNSERMVLWKRRVAAILVGYIN